MTSVRLSDTAIGVPALPKVDISAAHKALVKNPKFRRWGSAADGFDATGWLDHKETGTKATPSQVGVLPTFTRNAGNGWPSLKMFNSFTAPGLMTMGSANRYIKTNGDWSLCGVTRKNDSSGLRGILGNGNSTNFMSLYYATDGSVDFALDGSLGAYINTATNHSNQIIYWTLSYQHSSRSVKLSINGTVVGTTTSTAQTLANEELIIGGTFDGTTIVHAAAQVEIFDILCYDGALLETANAADFAQWIAYPRARYALA